ncbi:MAG: quinolinate synthase [Halobacteriovoraceae bacterium]|nr:quinolinate synthase [Halobacteriovoraceae bacterium]|tara:strand:+ start:594 stop:1697 length:1104 start_codon:yes stop_codon:yes gene_type:complete
MLELFESSTDYLPPIKETELSDDEVLEEITSLKQELGNDVVVLGHHYQQDDIIQFADYKGDSLALAKEAAKLSSPYVIFCGVHFMAETADMLTKDNQKVILPDLNAGCSMADMANSDQIDAAWERLSSATEEKIIPVTYINCSAELKAFVGKHEGSICTSSNAQKIITWALNQGDKLLFFPDQHLGRNTCFDMGIPLEKMVIYDPTKPNGGLTNEQIKEAKIILWHGFCSVHQGFTTSQIKNVKKDCPETIVIVHPECRFDVVQEADLNGSTAYIIETIKKAPEGSKFAVGTEINLVNRLANKYTNKKIFSLSPYQCLCTTMYRVRPRWLLASFKAIKAGTPINVIQVGEDTKRDSLLALDRMMTIS